jgi:RNA polymerase sigma-70 factor (ECF subfamily)
MSTTANPLEIAAEERGADSSPRRVPAFSWPDLVVIVRGQVRSLVGPTRDLEDLTQATLEQVVRAIGGFEGRCDLRTFTYRIASRVVMNHWRSLKRYFRRFVAGVDDAPDPSTEEEDPAGLLEQQRAKRLHHHLERLSAEQRLVVILSDLEELPASAIAEIVECPEATVRSRLKRGRADLARRLLRDPLFSHDGDERDGGAS